MNRYLLLSLPLLLLAACSDDKPEEQKQDTPNYGVFKQQMDALENAKGVEQQIQQGVKTRDQQLREMGG